MAREAEQTDHAEEVKSVKHSGYYRDHLFLPSLHYYSYISKRTARPHPHPLQQHFEL